MSKKLHRLPLLALAGLLLLPYQEAMADDSIEAAKDSLAYQKPLEPDSLVSGSLEPDSLVSGSLELPDEERHVAADSLTLAGGSPKKPRRDWTTWRPEPKRAMWLALVFPGGGQIYNRKYWKLPIIYGGFVGCAYAYLWNNTMYQDYKQAYLDIMDDDDSTNSYEQFLHLGNQITASNMSRYQSLFSKRKDRYRRWRDLSFFCLLGVYAISVIDAYVDASLSEFDISDDLSMRIEPAYIQSGSERNPLKNGGLGVHCSLQF